MTIQTETGKTVYIADGETTSFVIPFYFFDNQIAVYKNANFTPLIQGTDYTINRQNQQMGGSVIFITTPQSGDVITIVRNVELTQLITFIEGENFPASDYEYSLDKIVMALQQLRDELKSCVSIPKTSTLSVEDMYNLLISIDENLENILAIPTLYQNILAAKTAVEQSLSNYYTKTETETKINAAQAKIFTNVSALITNITEDSTYDDYPYKLNIALTGATATSIPVVTLSLNDAISGNFAPIADAYAGGISLYLKQVPAENFIIPSIILH